MRTKKSIKNIIYAVIGQILGLFVSFISRMFFIKLLGNDYLGVSGLFSNILSILSLVELGVGPAMIYSLYKPLALNDKEQVKSLMNLYKKSYMTIGIIILILGISLVPFLDILIKDKPNIDNLNIIYILFLLNTVVSYFYSYKRSLVIADQNKYITTLYKYLYFIILNIAQIAVLLITRNYILFLILQIVFTLLENISVSKVANKMYPYINEKNVIDIDKSTIMEIKKNIKAMIMHKIGGTIVTATDNLIISSFISIFYVGIYSNYQLIIQALRIITTQVFSSITASIGNLNVTNKDKLVDIFNKVFFVNFWIYSFSSISLIVLFNPFISLWLGEKYIFNIEIVALIVLNFYLYGMRQSVLTFRDALGLYWHDRYKPIIEAIINLIVSIILVKKIGVAGVFIGTAISTIFTCVWIEPIILYKYGFKDSVKKYFYTYFKYLIITMSVGYFTIFLNSFFMKNTLKNFIIKIIICLIVPNSIFYALFRENDNLNYLINILLKIKNKIIRI